MMNENIPGGRQRSSSESDILDENFNHNAESQSLTLDHKNLSRSFENRLCDQIDSDEEKLGSEKGYYTLQTKDKRRNKPLFKSVKKIVNRIRRTAHSHSATDVNRDMSVGKGGHNPQTNDVPPLESGTTSKRFPDSTSRPLITRPQTVALPWKVCPGTVGIQNHGNTCFMNAVIQCLSNTDALTGYFITKQHKQDLRSRGFSKKFSHNKSELTEQLALLFECLWSSNYSPDISSSFKSTVGKCNSQYKGSAQHDAQEFLLWLLDSINEELVLTSKKKHKFIKGKDTSDESLAEEVLANSKGCQVYHLFQALYRSSLQCPNCNKQSNTFETFLCLSLPLPQKTKRPVYVTIVYLDGDPRQVKVGLNINIQDTIKELRETLADNMKIPISQLVLCQIHEDGFRCTYSDDQPISDIPETEMVYAIETLPMPAPDRRHESPYLQLIVVHTVRESAPIKYFRFSPPEVLKVARDVDYKMLQRDILKHMADCVKEGLLSQKLDILFRIRVVEGSPGKGYLPHDVEMPLLTHTVERALSMCRDEYGPQHVKLVAEWEPIVQERVIVHENNTVEEHSSYGQLRRNSQQPVKVSLNDCLQLFTREETLSGDDAWNCPHCHKHQQAATKTIGLWSLPNVLVIHLKRFRQMGERRIKLNTFVDFPVKSMDMSDHILQRNFVNIEHDHQIYDLYGVCNHYGNMLGGHYTAFCKNPLDEKWYEFDDSKVKPISEAEVKTSSAYMLFYQKRGLNTNVVEGLQNRTHWIFKLCPSLLDAGRIDLKSNKEEISNRKDDHLRTVQNQENEEKEGLFSRQNSGRSDLSSKGDEKNTLSETHADKISTHGSHVNKLSAHGGATGHVSSKLVHNVSSSHTVSPELLQSALNHTSKSKSNNVQYSESQGPKSINRNGDFRFDTTDSSYDVDLRVILPPDNGMKQTNVKVDQASSARSNLYERQNVSRQTKQDKASSSVQNVEPPVKSNSENYSNTGTLSYSTSNQKSKDPPPRPPQKDQRQFPQQKPRAESDTQRNKTVQSNKRYDEVDSRRNVTQSSPQPPKRQIHTNWSTPQPPRKNQPTQQSQTPFKRQNSIPIKRSSSANRGYSKLTPSRSEEDLPTQSTIQNRNNNQREIEREPSNIVIPSNKGVLDMISTFNTMSKKISPGNEKDKPPIVPQNRRTDTGRSSRNDVYRRSESYQNAKNNFDQFEQHNRENTSKSNDDVYEQKRRLQNDKSDYLPNKSNNYNETQRLSRDVSDRIQIPKSKTDDNLSYNTPPHIYEAGSRKPFCEPSHSDSSSFSEEFPRYKPHKHYMIKPKEKVKSFRKEKMYSPCMKESSV